MMWELAVSCEKYDKEVSYVVFQKVWSSTEEIGYGEWNQTEERENREVIVYSKYIVKELWYYKIWAKTWRR
jgi:hypothetical protein